MTLNRVHIQDIVSDQLPQFVKDDFPLLGEFLEQYFISIETNGGSLDILNNIDQYVKVDNLYDVKTSTGLASTISYVDDTINTEFETNFTYGFPEKNGLIKIDDEIIFYKEKTDTAFINCVRGFSGITSYTTDTPDQLVFDQSLADNHAEGSTIQNLSVLFLVEFFDKIKQQFIPGFSGRNLFTGLDQRNFIFGAKSFYDAKGTDRSLKILFQALYGDEVNVIKPSEFLLRPSTANYSITRDFVIEPIFGNPYDLINRTIVQSRTDAQGTVTNVQRVLYNSDEYYQISVDFGYQRDLDRDGSIYGTFESIPNTKILNNVSIGQTVIDVDSTIGFPTEGELVSFNAGNEETRFEYTSKNDNQFLGVTGVSTSISDSKDIFLDEFSSTVNDDIRFRISTTLTDLIIKDDTYYYSKDDIVEIQSMGIGATALASQDLINNTKFKWAVSEVELIDATEKKYRISTFDDTYLKRGYVVEILRDDEILTSGDVIKNISINQFEVKLIDDSDLSGSLTVRNKILKANYGPEGDINYSFTNIINSYQKFNGDVLLSSNSFPTYGSNSEINTKNRTIKFSSSNVSGDTFTFSEDHGLYTGDAVVYKPTVALVPTFVLNGIQQYENTISKFSNMNEGVFFVKRVGRDNSKSLKLARSKSDLFDDIFVTPTGSVTDNELVLQAFNNRVVSPQKIYREIKTPFKKRDGYDIYPGKVGILKNGVEVSHYKSNDVLYYGEILSIDVVNGGSGYDIINPPIVHISDSVGSGATGKCAVTGSLEEIRILDTGFDYVNDPVITISGGNPDVPAQIKAETIDFVHKNDFLAESGGGLTTSVYVGVGNTAHKIGFSTYHKFFPGERVIYFTNKGNNIVGLSSFGQYFAEIVDNKNIRLHTTRENALAGINTINISEFGTGLQSIHSFDKKKILSKVHILDSGSGYKNKERKIVGVKTYTDTITIKNHGYRTGEQIRYTPSNSNISGILSTTNYYVHSIDKDNIKLSQIGVGATSNYYFDNKVFVSIASTGNGTFNYEPISVTIEGVIGIATLSNQDFNAKVQPIFRGSIDSIDITEGGSQYGSQEVLNFNRPPNVDLKAGTDAQITSIINNGRVTSFIINEGGKEYNSPPNIKITGPGEYSKLTPVINDGKLTEIKVINGGAGFNSSSLIEIESPIEKANLDVKLRKWNVNLLSKHIDVLDFDDGVIVTSLDNESLQYSHLYAPRELRRKLNPISDAGVQFGQSDLELDSVNGSEKPARFHSPIIGWAYDGHPIYGPYGYANADGGTVKLIEPGYELKVDTTNRPSLSFYPEGFFIEDYQFTRNGDLDEHNGRFCITPDFPNGEYVYFSTIESTNNSSGVFNKFRQPKFPYIIGETFNSQPNVFNFRKTSNHDNYDFTGTGWLRNTLPYNLYSDNSGYDYIFNSNEVKNQSFNINSTSVGGVEKVNILSEGDNYKVNDRIIFNNSGSNGFGANAKIELIKGKTVVSSATSSIELDVEFSMSGERRGKFIGFTTNPHKIKDGTLVNLSSNTQRLSGFDGNYFIGVRTDSFNINLGVGDTSVTGLTTYFYVTGTLNFPIIRPNDILGISSERVKVLNIDRKSGRIRVAREQDNTVGAAYSVSDNLVEDPRKFTVTTGLGNTTSIIKYNREYYFEPAESIGIGTIVGTAHTIFFSNPPVGFSSVTIKSQQIYIPDHGLDLNELVSYNNFTGTAVSTWNGVTDSYNLLTDYDELYVAPISRDIIGISSTKVGIASTGGGYVGLGTTTGLLFFPGFGSGDYHSFKTVKSNALSGKLGINTVTVSTASTHGLTRNDRVIFNLNPTTIKNISVRYNDNVRRFVFDPRSFVSDDVNIIENTITLTNHGFNQGDKILYTSSTPVGGLVDQEMYFVSIYGTDKIQLCKELVDLKNNSVIDLTSANSGTIARINPYIKISKNQKLKFDLTDSSLKFRRSSIDYSAFKLKVYSDITRYDEYLTSKGDAIFEVSETGRVGITTDASLTINFNDSFDKINLWYKFLSDNIDILPLEKSEHINDTDSFSYNQIDVVDSVFDGIQRISGIGTTTFQFEISKKPESLHIGISSAIMSYTTNSSTAQGPIEKIKIFNTGSSYTSIPGISSVVSKSGTGAILEPEGKNIGKILSYSFNRNSIGFEYPSDTTLRPVANLPEILKVVPLSSFKSIGISSGGINYYEAPKLVAVDGFTKKIIRDAQFDYELGDTNVRIVKNTTGIYNTTPTLIPINNSNGVGISSLTYNDSTQIVRLYFNTTFSDASSFPYYVGGKILIENVSIGIGTLGKGYNSENYDYKLFEVSAVEPQLGGSGPYLEFSLADFISTSEYPGIAIEPVLGRVVPEEHFPIFDIEISPNDFLVGETVSNGKDNGKVLSWNENIELLKIAIQSEVNVGDLVVGKSSKTQGLVGKKINFNAEITTGAGATVINGWQDEVGFLNESFQRIPNNEYYQNFSYAIKSKVSYDTWNSAVNVLNHTAGFAKFSDLQIVSELDDEEQNIVTTSDSNVETVVDLTTFGNLNCVYNFDYVSESTEYINSTLYSNEIIFENVLLTDFFESIGNRVLSIDDISTTFNSNERANRFAAVGDFTNNLKFNKVLSYAKDSVFTDQRQFAIVSVVQDDNFGYIDEYSILDTVQNLGFYDFQVTGTGWDLTFNPSKFELNNYNTSIISFSGVSDYTGVGSEHSFGLSVNTTSEQNTVSAGTTTTIVSVGTSYRSAKVLVMLQDSSSNYVGNELTIVQDGTNVDLLEYGGIDDVNSSTFSGFGTYNAYIDGSTVKIDFIPDASTPALTANTQIIATNTAETGVGTMFLDVGRLRSVYAGISSSGSPGINTVAVLEDPYESGYYFFTITDSSNNVYESFELAVVKQGSETESAFVEFANVSTGTSIGQVGLATDGTNLNITYTPNPSIDVEVRGFGVDLQIFDENTNASQIDYFNWEVNSRSGSYTGTKFDIVDSFNLTHEGLNIFRRIVDGSNAGIADSANNFVRIPEHFFVTGEEIVYNNSGAGTTQSIGIASTSVAGIVTDKLPSSLFVVKVNDGAIKFAETAEKALKLIPETFTINSVGVGDSHVFTSKNQNTKTLFAIDNLIQSPVVSTAVTSALSESIIFAERFQTVGVTSIFSGDLIKIDDEFMEIIDVGIGSTGRLGVRRPLLGSTIASHGIGATITKMAGNFNIVGNTLHLAAAPFGNVPIGSITNPPDSRDFSGITTRSHFQGRTFIRNLAANSTNETYSSNYAFDDISHEFTGIKSDFILKSSGQNTSGFSTNNGIILINGVFQLPTGEQAGSNSYEINEDAGISTIKFSGTILPEGYDTGKGNLPLGGVIVSVASTEGFGYQPLVSAGGTGVVSGLGTISSVSIGNSGSGYRSGVQTSVNVSVALTEGYPPVQTLGIATISNGHVIGVAITNPGVGFTNTNPPILVFDDPLSYSNIPLLYHSTSSVGVGTSATVDIIVGQGSSVIDFKINDFGYGYGNQEILTVAIGGTVGIPTNTDLSFSDFKLTVQEVFNDSFNGWSFGQMQVFDSFASEFNGARKSFRLQVNGNSISISAGKGSLVDVEQTLIVFINDVLQKPGEAFEFNGGSLIEFAEPPKTGDSVKVLYYKGSGDDIDVRFRDVLETVKPGDSLDINFNPRSGQSIILDQEERVVIGINTMDSLETNPYNGPGVSSDRTLLRPVTWCKQTHDIKINNAIVGKDREHYEPLYRPSAYLISPVSASSTSCYVNNLIPSFAPSNEISNTASRNLYQRKIEINNQKTLTGAAATATVGGAGTVTSFTVTNAGTGYTVAPNVIVSNPIGFGNTSGRAEATAVISGGSVTSINVSYGGTTTGTAYTSTNPPSVLIEPPSLEREQVNVVSYSGDYGVIVGIATTTAGSQHVIKFDTYIPAQSFMRDPNYVGTGITISGISTGDYFVVNGTSLSIGSTFASQVSSGGTTVGIANTALDCVYQVQSFEDRILTVFVDNTSGITTAVRTLTVNVDNISVGISSTTGFESGQYSWGKIQFDERPNAIEFPAHTMSGIGSAYSDTGISTSSLVRRFNPLKFKSYS